MSSEIQTYFDRLRASLHLHPQLEDELVRELLTHIEDRASELEQQGLGREEALRRALQRLDRPQALARRFHEAYLQASWHDALTAATPFLLVGAVFATGLWSHAAVAPALTLLIVGVTLYGLWQGRPPWFYPWAGLALTLLSFAGYFAFLAIQRTAQAALAAQAEPVALLGFAGAALYFPIAVLILITCIAVASRRDWLDASLMLSPTAPVVVWLAALHQRGGVTLDALDAGADLSLAATFLAMAGAVALFVRVRSRTMKLTTLMTTATLVLFAASYIHNPAVSLPDLTARAALLYAFLLSPALLASLIFDRLGDTIAPK